MYVYVCSNHKHQLFQGDGDVAPAACSSVNVNILLKTNKYPLKIRGEGCTNIGLSAATSLIYLVHV